MFTRCIIGGVLAGLSVCAVGSARGQLQVRPQAPARVLRVPDALRPPPALLFTYEEANSATGWAGFAGSTVWREASGGQPGAFLHISGMLSNDPCGAWAFRPEFQGRYVDPGALAFDYQVSVAQVADYELGIELARAGFGVWRHGVDVPHDSLWHHASIEIDPNWSDAQAETKGWHNAGVGSQRGTWQGVLQQLYGFNIRAWRRGDQQQHKCDIGIDNLIVQQ